MLALPKHDGLNIILLLSYGSGAREAGCALDPGQGRCAPRRQSLLRSCLAAHSFPRRPPATCCPPSEQGDTDTTVAETRPLGAGDPTSGGRKYESMRNCGSPNRAKPLHAGGGGGKECAARHERSNDWPQGARSAPPNPYEVKD